MTSELDIKQPDNVPVEPDDDTKTSPDFTGDTAASRVLYLNWGWFRYGTDDTGHAAALVLSVILLFVILLIIFIGIFWHLNPTWMDRVFTWLGSAFLFVTGVAIGKSIDR